MVKAIYMALLSDDTVTLVKIVRLILDGDNNVQINRKYGII